MGWHVAIVVFWALASFSAWAELENLPTFPGPAEHFAHDACLRAGEVFRGATFARFNSVGYGPISNPFHAYTGCGLGSSCIENELLAAGVSFTTHGLPAGHTVVIGDFGAIGEKKILFDLTAAQFAPPEAGTVARRMYDELVRQGWTVLPKSGLPGNLYHQSHPALGPPVTNLPEVTEAPVDLAKCIAPKCIGAHAGAEFTEAEMAALSGKVYEYTSRAGLKLKLKVASELPKVPKLRGALKFAGQFQDLQMAQGAAYMAQNALNKDLRRMTRGTCIDGALFLTVVPPPVDPADIVEKMLQAARLDASFDPSKPFGERRELFDAAGVFRLPGRESDAKQSLEALTVLMTGRRPPQMGGR